MIKIDEIRRALDLHARSYRLLRWFSSAINKGVVTLNHAHASLDGAAAAKAWIEAHSPNMPSNCRTRPEDLEAFSQFFATYLTTSFDLLDKPGERLKSGCGCYCPICTYMTSASHLQVKKLKRRDKERAQELKAIALQRFAQDLGVRLEPSRIETLAESPDSAMHLSVFTYALQLIARTRGESQGPAVLALWREIAWDPRGAPRKGFTLTAEMVMRAQESLQSQLTSS